MHTHYPPIHTHLHTHGHTCIKNHLHSYAHTHTHTHGHHTHPPTITISLPVTDSLASRILTADLPRVRLLGLADTMPFVTPGCYTEGELLDLFNVYGHNRPRGRVTPKAGHKLRSAKKKTPLGYRNRGCTSSPLPAFLRKGVVSLAMSPPKHETAETDETAETAGVKR